MGLITAILSVTCVSLASCALLSAARLCVCVCVLLLLMWAQGFQEEDLEALEGHATNLGDADSTSAHTPTDPARRVNAASVAGLAGGASAGAAAAAAEADAEAGSGHGAAGEAKELPLPPGWTKKAMSKSNGKMVNAFSSFFSCHTPPPEVSGNIPYSATE